MQLLVAQTWCHRKMRGLNEIMKTSSLAATRLDKHGSYDVMTADGLASYRTALKVSSA